MYSIPNSEDDIINISQMKNIKNRTAPGSQRKFRTLNINSNIIESFPIKTDNVLYKIKEKENKNDKLKNKISELENEIKRQKDEFQIEILILKEENENIKAKNKEYSKNKNNDKNMISKLKRKINILSDENITLLNEIKSLRNKIMNLKKDKQYLIEQIADLNKSLNNKIKPKLNENEDNLMKLKNQIIELKNKNNKLLKENDLQKEIIKDLKGEIHDIHHKTSILCKNDSLINKLESENDIKNISYSKNYISMKNLNNYNKKYYLVKGNKRINTENTKNNNPFYKTKNGNMYINNNQQENMTHRTKLNKDVSYIIDDLVNFYNRRKNKTPKNISASFNVNNNKFNKFLLMKKNKENKNKNNKEYIMNFKMEYNKKHLYKNNNKNENYILPYYKSNEKFDNIKKYEDENEDIKTRNQKLNNNIINNKSLLSSYIDE